MAMMSGKSVLVTGANRGIGRALVEEALPRGAARVYADTRQPFALADGRVVPLVLDVTDDAQIRAAADAVPSLDLLIDNAGLALRGDDLSDRALLERHLSINFFGIFDVTLALLPALTESQGSVVNILSMASWVNLPQLPGYSVSKAAAFSLTQGLRAHLANRGVRIHAAMIGVVDTDMTQGFGGPKASPACVAARIIDGLDRGEDKIFPPMPCPHGSPKRGGPAPSRRWRSSSRLRPPADRSKAAR